MMGLAIRDLTVRFGGVMAVDSVSLDIPSGIVVGLIGPNGAGKTTTFNGVSGLVRSSSGQVQLDGTDITGRSPAARARLGLGRTFQHPAICGTLDVKENVGMGLEARRSGRSPIRQLLGRTVPGPDVSSRISSAIELCGIEHIADRRAGTLTLGQRRLVELARVVAGGFSILLLDEPSSGLDDEETGAFAKIIQRLVQERGIGVLLVEHDVSLVVKLCEKVYVLEYGQLIFEGSTNDLRASSVVRNAYLGDSLDDMDPAALKSVL